jgi:hypothetical protein
MNRTGDLLGHWRAWQRQSARRTPHGYQSIQAAHLSPCSTDHSALQLASEFTKFSAQFNAQGDWLDHLMCNVFTSGT